MKPNNQKEKKITPLKIKKMPKYIIKEVAKLQKILDNMAGK